MPDSDLLQRIRNAQERALCELFEQTARVGRVPGAIEAHRVRVNAGEEVVMASLKEMDLALAAQSSRST